jgi:hypothetical protein
MSVFTRAPHSTVLTDENGYTLTSSTPLPVNPAESGTANMATAQASITGGAVQIVGVRATRRAVVITNTHASLTIYLGSASVSTSTGHALPAGNSISIPFTGAIYGIVVSSTAVATALEVYD